MILTHLLNSKIYLLKFFCSLLLATVIISCNNAESTSKQETKKDSVISLNDTIPLKREQVDEKPVADFDENKGDAGINVKVYETAETFDYLLKVKYHGHNISDTLKVPNFGIWPKVEIKKAETDNACIVGFLDNKGAFKEYKLIAGNGDKLNIKILKRYAVATYRAGE